MPLKENRPTGEIDGHWLALWRSVHAQGQKDEGHVLGLEFVFDAPVTVHTV